MKLSDLTIKLFADGADVEQILKLAALPAIKGFTTNPTLMRQAGVENYRAFARAVLPELERLDKPISFEVFADDLNAMYAQAREIDSWGENIYVKIPVMNTAGRFTGSILSRLSAEGVKLNVTAIMTFEQTQRVVDSLSTVTPAIVSVFAGRIADTGVDPVSTMAFSINYAKLARSNVEVLWASPRQPLDIVLAQRVGASIITVTPALLKKAKQCFGKNLEEFSRETVKMFYDDAKASGYSL